MAIFYKFILQKKSMEVNIFEKSIKAQFQPQQLFIFH